MNKRGGIEDERRFTLRMSEELAREIDLITEKTGINMTEFIRRACREKLDRESSISPDAHVSRAEFDELKRRFAELEEDADAMKRFIEATKKDNKAGEA